MIDELSQRVRVLIAERRLPWRLTRLGGFWNTVVKVPLRRLWMRTVLRFRDSTDRHDVTVLIGARNRSDHRLRNALMSIRAQDYPSHLVHIMLVDYGSDRESVPHMRALCAEFKAHYRRVEHLGVWNKAHCLNVGIREAQSTYILSTDVDIVFSESYVSEAVGELRRDPLQVIYSQSLDLPEATAKSHLSINPSEINQLRHLATPRFAHPSAGINLARRSFYQMLNGYDEAFTVYGGEDDDLSRRFEYLGLVSGCVAPRAFYLHQWHPKHEGLEAQELTEHLTKNAEYLKRHHSIRRNPTGWGIAPPSGNGH
jgi:glycosyltransferase involved in cell wall biosynthesis